MRMNWDKKISNLGDVYYVAHLDDFIFLSVKQQCDTFDDLFYYEMQVLLSDKHGSMATLSGNSYCSALAAKRAATKQATMLYDIVNQLW